VDLVFVSMMRYVAAECGFRVFCDVILMLLYCWFDVASDVVEDFS
jgi:hypothetical protein